MSLAYGADYILTKDNASKELFSFKFANNIRLNKNHDLERNNQLGSKTSNFFGELTYNPISFISTKYNFCPEGILVCILPKSVLFAETIVVDVAPVEIACAEVRVAGEVAA